MKKSFCFTIFFLCLLPIHAGSAKIDNTSKIEIPRIKSYQASYQLYWNGIAVGQSNHTVKELCKNHYWAQSHSFPKLSFLPFEDLEQGEFIKHKQEFRPLKYTFRSQANHKHLEGELTFDWQTLKVTKHIKENLKDEEETIPLHAKDKISFFFQLREALRLGKKEIQFTIIEAKKVSHWHMKAIAEEELHTPLGTFNTIKLENKMDNNNRVTQFWVAKELDYILVKLVQYHKGKKSAEVLIKDFDTPPHKYLTTE